MLKPVNGHWQTVIVNQYSDVMCELKCTDVALGFYEVPEEDREKICTLLMDGDILEVKTEWKEVYDEV